MLPRGTARASSNARFAGHIGVRPKPYARIARFEAALECTEIPLVVSDSNSPLPTLDSTRLLARAALARAVRPAST